VRRSGVWVRTVESERVDEAVAEIVAEVEDFAVGDLAVGLVQPDMPFRMQPLVFWS